MVKKTNKENAEIKAATDTTKEALAFDDMLTTAVSERQKPSVFETVDNQSDRLPQWHTVEIPFIDPHAPNSAPNTRTELLSKTPVYRKVPNMGMHSEQENNDISQYHTTDTTGIPVAKKFVDFTDSK